MCVQGLGRTRVILSVVSFVLLAAPFASVAALSDVLTSSVRTKLQLTVACASIGEAFDAVFCAVVLLRLDWIKTAAVVNERANTDRQTPEPHEPATSAGGGGCEPLSSSVQ